MRNRELHQNNQRGFIHHVVPILTFAALFAIFGAYLLLRSSPAQTPYYYIESAAHYNPAFCLSDVSGTADLAQCGSQWSDATISQASDYYIIHINSACLQSTGTGAIFAKCNSSTVTQRWSSYGTSNNGPTYLSPANVANAPCLGSATAGALKEMKCANSSTDTWDITIISPPATGNPGPGRPVTVQPINSGPTIAQYYKTAAQPCYEYSYSIANVRTAYYCVAAFQNMLNGMRSFDGTKTATLTIDGQFGTQTSQATKDYQKYENTSLLSANGDTNPNTWKFMCWSMYNRKLTGSGTPTGIAYAYAECTRDGVTPGTKP